MKTTTTVTIDVELYQRAKLRDINISGLLDDYLRVYLEMPREKKGTNIVKRDDRIRLLKEQESRTSVKMNKIRSELINLESAKRKEQEVLIKKREKENGKTISVMEL